jgi:hypothetical protein
VSDGEKWFKRGVLGTRVNDLGGRSGGRQFKEWGGIVSLGGKRGD